MAVKLMGAEVRRKEDPRLMTGASTYTGDVSLPGLELSDRPLVLVIGSEGKGLSRPVTETCDAIVSIPISAATESLNAGIAASVVLYQVSTTRAAAGA